MTYFAVAQSVSLLSVGISVAYLIFWSWHLFLTGRGEARLLQLLNNVCLLTATSAGNQNSELKNISDTITNSERERVGISDSRMWQKKVYWSSADNSAEKDVHTGVRFKAWIDLFCGSITTQHLSGCYLVLWFLSFWYLLRFSALSLFFLFFSVYVTSIYGCYRKCSKTCQCKDLCMSFWVTQMKTDKQILKAHRSQRSPYYHSFTISSRCFKGCLTGIKETVPLFYLPWFDF